MKHTQSPLFRAKRWLLLVGAALLLAGCATGPDANPRDPFEPLNRGIYQFNDAVDTGVIKPVAEAYVEVTPSLVRTGVRNFFGNLGDLWSFVNAGLQARPQEAVENLARFNVNTLFGFGGVLDIASEMGIPRTRLEFGQTLGRWGVPSGPYLVLPLLGPSTVRDTTGIVVETSASPTDVFSDNATRNGLLGLRIIDTRASLLRATGLLDQAALDKYSFTRDLYLQRRDNQIEALIEQGAGVRDEDTNETNGND